MNLSVEQKLEVDRLIDYVYQNISGWYGGESTYVIDDLWQENWSFHLGASKAVAVPNDELGYDFVVKFPLLGSSTERYIDSCSCDYLTTVLDFEDLNCSQKEKLSPEEKDSDSKCAVCPAYDLCSDRELYCGFRERYYNSNEVCLGCDSQEYEIVTYEWEYLPEEFEDYCQLEVAVYQHACESGLQELFAKTEPYKDPAGRIVYLQEKATDGCYAIKVSPESEKIFDSNTKIKYFFPDRVAMAIIEDKGLETLLKLVEFVKEEQINDFHSGNIMLRNNKICFIDYSGYYDN